MTSPAQELLRDKLVEKLKSGDLTVEQLKAMSGTPVVEMATQTDGASEASDGGDPDQLIQEIVALIFEDEGAVDLTSEEMDQLINDLFEQVEA